MENNEENIEKKNKSLKEKIEEWCHNTSIQGLPNIVRNENKLIKLVWIIFLIIFSSLGIYNVSLNFLDYFEFKTDTLIELRKENQFEFPTITFCNLQICDFDGYDFNNYLTNYKNEEAKKFGEQHKEVIDKKMREDNTRTNYFLAKEIFLRQHNDNDLNKVLNKNKISIKKFLISCSFMGKDCDENDFDSVLMGEFHKCYKFNSGKMFDDTFSKTKWVDLDKKDHGLHLEMYIGSQSECKSPLVSNSGMVVYVHNKTHTITEDDAGVLIQPGTHSEIGVLPTFIKKLSNPYSDCFDMSMLSEHSDEIKDGRLVENKLRKKIKDDLIQSLVLADKALVAETINLTNSYTQQYCLQLCYQQFLIRFCKCYDHTLSYYTPNGYNPCPKFIDSLYNCQYLIKRLFYNGKNDEKCLKKCPIQCEINTYDIAISSSSFPSPAYIKTINKLVDENKNFLKNLSVSASSLGHENVLSMKIFFRSSTFTNIIEKPSITIVELLSGLGGSLGLFLGMSILSIVELFELILSVILTIAFCGCSMNKKNEKEL